MANTLESIMRLTDEYTATMKKVIDSADQYDKTQQRASKAAATFQSGLKNVGPSSNTAASGISAIVLKIGGLVTAASLAKKVVDTLFDAIKTGAKQQVQLTTFQSLMGNAKLGADMYNYVAAYAKTSALGRSDLASAATSFLAYTKDVNQIQQLLNLAQRLYMFNPEQGAEGAVFALKEVLSGQTMSLRNRFNMMGISAETVQKNFENGDIDATIKYLDESFNKFGATQGVVDANFHSLTAQAQKFSTNFQEAMGSQSSGAVKNLSQTLTDLNAQLDEGKFQGFFNAIADGANALAKAAAWLAQNFQVVIPTMAAVIGAFAAYKIASDAIKLTTLITGITVSTATGNWIGLGLAIAGAASASYIANKILNSSTSDAATQIQSAQDAANKLAADQRAQGASTKGNSADVNITNKDPIKVSGTVEIEKENLKYVFDAATAKFFATFNATKVEPVFTIQHQDVHQEADVQEINKRLAGMITEAAGVTPGGGY